MCGEQVNIHPPFSIGLFAKMPRRGLEAVEGKQTKFAMSALRSFECTAQVYRDSLGKRTRRTKQKVVMHLQLTEMHQLHHQGLYGAVFRGRGRSKGVFGTDEQDSMPLQNRNARDVSG